MTKASDDKLQNELQCLRGENQRLKALLNQHHIAWEEKVEAKPLPTPPADMSESQLSIKGKINLFKRLFRGRDDVYPQRWESANLTSIRNYAMGYQIIRPEYTGSLL